MYCYNEEYKKTSFAQDMIDPGFDVQGLVWQKMWVIVMQNTLSDGLTSQLMIWEGYSKIWQLEKLGDEGWGGWVGVGMAGFC